MKIIHVNFSDFSGGAAIAVRRFHNLLLTENVDSNIVVSETNFNTKKSFFIKKTSENIKNIFKKTLSRQIKYIFKSENKNTHSLNIIPSNLLKLINHLKPDFVNLHWIGNETISISDINKINSEIIWTLHDMWPFCGSEHYTDDQRYVDGYKKTNRARSEYGIDINKFIWNLKRKNYNKITKIICTSDWMFRCASNSILFKNLKIKQIPLTLDYKFWNPKNKKFAKEIFGINEDEITILYGADNFIKNPRKGFDFLKRILKNNFLEKKYKIIFFGVSMEHDFTNINKNIINLGIVNDETTLRSIYSASDVVLIPSYQESFGLVALEAIHCGIPCVIFENTGLTSIINHKINGYISKLNSENDFLSGIKWCLNNLISPNENIYKNAVLKFNYIKIIDEYKKFLQS
jgi:glycosyltransferase involved in cell wall biosynthesis